ncbi:MAG: hypothetical protein H6813_01910 [Phycisphaeraceae bacterium]|nr:hypothetical protein [Phycisphaeraceae bacterium]
MSTTTTNATPARPPGQPPQAIAQIPMAPMLGAITIASVVVGGLGQLVVLGIQRQAQGLEGTDPASAWLGALGVWVAFLAGTFTIRPWRRMPMQRWAALWLAGRGICFVATVLAGVVLLYSAPQENRAVIGLVMAGGYLGVLAAETAVVAKALQRSRGGCDAGEIND